MTEDQNRVYLARVFGADGLSNEGGALVDNVEQADALRAIAKRAGRAALLAMGELEARRRGIYRIASPLEWHRAGGNTICAHCSLEYLDHYVSPVEDKFELHKLCNGTLVKL